MCARFRSAAIAMQPRLAHAVVIRYRAHPCHATGHGQAYSLPRRESFFRESSTPGRFTANPSSLASFQRTHCFFCQSKDNAATPDAYLISTFYKGYWGATQVRFILPFFLRFTRLQTVVIGVTSVEWPPRRLLAFTRPWRPRRDWMPGTK